MGKSSDEMDTQGVRQETGMGPPRAAQHQVLLSGNLLPAHFRTESYQIAKDVINYICRHDSAMPPASKTAGIMRSLVDDTLKNRLEMMREMVLKLDVQRREQLDLLNNIASEMFSDELVNWGRIVTLYSFAGYLARYCEERHIPDCGDDIALILGNIVVNRLGLWIVANGGWASFEETFPTVTFFESSGIFKGLAIFALLLGAVLAFYSSIRFMSS